LRIGNAAVSYVVYLRQMFCPAGLAVLYPYPQNSLPGWKIALAVVLLAAISAGVFLRRQRQPYLLMGWLWYLGMLIPVIGLVQVGGQAHADRYTYLPQIGLYLALIWAVGSLGAGWRHRRVVLGGLSTVILVALIFCARAQTSYWRNSEVLWTHTLACTSDNYIAHYNLGDALVKMGRRDEAIAQYQKTLQITPNYAEAHDNLGSVLLQKGRVDEAIAHYQTALRITPENATAHNNLGNALRQKGRVDEAIAQCQVALQINPDYADAHDNLGNALFQKRRVAEAITHYQKALQINPDYAEAHNNLAWVLATAPQVSLRNGDEAVKLAERANQLTGGKTPIILHTLAAAYAEAGRFGDAIRSVQKAIELAQAAGQKDLAERFTGELKLYEAGLPFHEKSK
jgi:tetratricopeptide (TPR) repeat protein